MASKLMFRGIALLGFLLVANGPDLRALPSPTYRIAGIVVDSVTSQPLEGAEVTIAPVTALDDAQTFRTSSAGRFFFANLPAGKYRLMASRRGYALQALNEHEAYSTAIVVGPGLDSEHIRFRLSPSSIITGVVTDDWGDPVRDAKVLLFQQNMFEGSRALRNINQSTTDDQGRYRFAHLRAGTYAVAVYARPWYATEHSDILSQTIANLRSSVSSSDQVVSDARFRQVLDQGILEASLSELFDVVYPITYFPNATSLTEATRFPLAPGATETADFQLRAVPSVHVRVRVPVEPSVPVTVTSQQEDGQQTANQEESPADVAQVDTTPDVALALKIGDSFTDPIEPSHREIAPGLVEFSGIPPGQIDVSMMTGPEDTVVSRGRTLDLLADTELDLSAMGDAAAVSGEVLSTAFSETLDTAVKRNAPENLSNVMLSLRSLKTGESFGATVSLQGRFSFAASTLPAGSYEVELTQGGLRVSSLEATGATVSGRTIEIPAGQPVNLTVQASEANCTLSGVALKNGKPVAGAMILLVPQDPGHDMSLYHRDQSDSDGSFTMSPLFPGRYILLAIENGWDLEWADPKVMFQYFPGSQPVELKPNASLTLNPKVR